MTLTVPEAARATGRNPETIRLRASKVGTHHVIDERDLGELIDAGSGATRVNAEWRTTFWGAPMPAVVAAVRRSREGH